MSMTLRAALTSLLAGSCLPAGCQQSGGSNANQMAANLAAPLPGLPASLPMQAGAATPATVAPRVAALPYAPRPALRRLADPGSGYAYLDRAASYDDALGEAPPDYAFDYDGVNPWGWQANDGSIEYAEPVDGGYRYYYYQPGARTPYLVRDPGYSYAYDGAALVMIYDHGGRPLPPNAYGTRWDDAGRYLARAQALRAAAQATRRGVVAANWAARRADIAAANAEWSAARARDAAWAAYNARAAGQQDAHWQAERNARGQATQRFAAYQHGGLQGPPPSLARDPRGPGEPPPRRFAPPPAADRRLPPEAAPPRQVDQARAIQHAHEQQAAAQHALLDERNAAEHQAARAHLPAAEAPGRPPMHAGHDQHATARQPIDHRPQRATPERSASEARPAPTHADQPHRAQPERGAPPQARPARSQAAHGSEAPHEHAAPAARAAPPRHEAPARPAPAPHAAQPSAPRPEAQPHAVPGGGGHEHGPH